MRSKKGAKVQSTMEKVGRKNGPGAALSSASTASMVRTKAALLESWLLGERARGVRGLGASLRARRARARGPRARAPRSTHPTPLPHAPPRAQPLQPVGEEATLETHQRRGALAVGAALGRQQRHIRIELLQHLHQGASGSSSQTQELGGWEGRGPQPAASAPGRRAACSRATRVHAHDAPTTLSTTTHTCWMTADSVIMRPFTSSTGSRPEGTCRGVQGVGGARVPSGVQAEVALLVRQQRKDTQAAAPWP